MSDTYGVLPTGYLKKPLAAFLADLEQANMDRFGSDIIQDAQSPLGQINGLLGDLCVYVEQHIEATYQSFDIDQQEAARLDQGAKYQRLTRLLGEGDVPFRTRITNTGKADIKLVSRLAEIQSIDGVTFANITENSSDTTNGFGMPAHSVAYAVQGGDDEEVALSIYENGIGGITLFGNYIVSIVADGHCQTLMFIRPVDVPIRVEVDVRHIPDPCDCAPPSTSTITNGIIAAFARECGYRNGDTVLRKRITSETAQLGNLEIIDTRISRAANSIEASTLPMTLYERPVIIAPFVTVRYVA